MPGQTELIQAGILGVVLVVMIWASAGGKIWWEPAVKGMREFYERAIDMISKQRDEQKEIAKEALTALRETIAALEERNRVDKEMLREREERRAGKK